jgi:GNAT superfamily N-acetyltransferase
MISGKTDRVLDNPVWNALMTGNSKFAKGNEYLKYFDSEISPFAAMPDVDQINWEHLGKEISPKRPVAIFSPEEVHLPSRWILIELMNVLQLVYAKLLQPEEPFLSLIPLLKENTADMVDLAGLTHPGPFLTRTIEFGNYEGIFVEGKLVAMAGQRLHPTPYIEISAVCTHPDFSHRGFATNLIYSQIKKIKSNSGIPFLHVKADHHNTLKLYEKLGFRVRKRMYLYFIEKRL